MPKLRAFLRRRSLVIAATALLLVGVSLALGWRWSREPPLYLETAGTDELPSVAGFVTVASLIGTIDWLLDKPGGYLSNDVSPPSLWLDNMKAFEFGVLVQSRDLARILRSDYSRSRAQTSELPELVDADEALGFSNDSWILPSTESKLREARDALVVYRSSLVELGGSEPRFFAEADNLREWLGIVERRLGNLSQRLAASVGRPERDGDPAGRLATEAAAGLAPAEAATRWLEIDDVFFEARGSAWAMLQFLTAAERDFDEVLRTRNALAGLQSIRRDLEAALAPLSSPFVLNGRGYGLFANHSLVQASFLARARASVIELEQLLAIR